MKYGAEEFNYTFVPTNEEETPAETAAAATTTSTSTKDDEAATESSKLVAPSTKKGEEEEANATNNDYNLMSSPSNDIVDHPAGTSGANANDDTNGEPQQQPYKYIPPSKKHRKASLHHDPDDDWGTSTSSSHNPSAAAAASLSFCGACCCCITAALLIAGGVMVAYGGYENSDSQADNGVNGDKYQFIGSLVLVVSAGTFLIGCCSCCFGCASASLADGGGGGGGVFGGGGGGGDLGGGGQEIKVKFKRLNDRFEGANDALERVHLDLTSDMKEIKEAKKKEKKKTTDVEKEKHKTLEEHVKSDLEAGLDVGTIRRKYRPIAFLIKFDGDVMVSNVELLTKQVSTIVKVGRPKVDQAIIVISSPGGSVSSYGLASSQLCRIRKAGIHLVVCVDTVAASGGYMMASVGDLICAAPFAMIGSIGVVTQIPNFHRFLDKNSIDAYLFTAGKYKRTVDVIGEVTEDGKEKLQEELDDIHRAFKDHVALARPRLKDTIEDVATGEYWLAVQAKELGLVDAIMTSNEYIESICSEYDVIEIAEKKKKSILTALHYMKGMKSIMEVFSFFGGRDNQRGHEPLPMAISNQYV